MYYFCTITLRPRFYQKTPEQQFDILKEELIRELSYNKERQTIVFELTKAFNIHAHGLLHLKKSRELHDLFRGNKIIGFIKVEQPKNYEQCMQYIFKNVSDTYNTLRLKHPVIKNDEQYEYRLHPAMPHVKQTKESIKDELLELKLERVRLKQEVKDLARILNGS